MAESSTDKGSTKTGVAGEATKESVPKAKQSIFRRSFSILGRLFHRTSREDFEKKLRNLSKEEASVHTRMKRRSQTWRRLARGVIVYSVIVELLILGLAVIATRAPEISWQMQALRVLPVFVFPALAVFLYTGLARYYRMRERKDQKHLNRLQNERQAKINELKETTNYYLTQQLIQKYDSDPTAKEAAARVLAAKLGVDAGGLKLSSESSPGDAVDGALAETVLEATGQNAASIGPRRRVSLGRISTNLNKEIDAATSSRTVRKDAWQPKAEADQFLGKVPGGGLLARVAAMLVGEDLNQSYALICAYCHAHNGLSRKEDFPLVTYYCPHCNFLNGPRPSAETEGGQDSQEPIARDGRTIARDGLRPQEPIARDGLEPQEPIARDGLQPKENGLHARKVLEKQVKAESGRDFDTSKKTN